MECGSILLVSGGVRMQFESKIRRQYWINAILGWIPDLIISGIISLSIGGGAWTFVLAIMGLQLLYFLIWIKNTIWGWFIFGAYGKKHLVGMFRDFFAENNFPEPELYEGSAEEYFSRIATDESLPVPLRLKAIGEATALRMPATIGQYQYAIRLAMAYENAITIYKRNFVSRKRSGSPSETVA
jgi:hypothetical protein